MGYPTRYKGKHTKDKSKHLSDQGRATKDEARGQGKHEHGMRKGPGLQGACTLGKLIIMYTVYIN